MAEGRPAGTLPAIALSSSEPRDWTGPGARPVRMESWFSLCAIWRSMSGMAAAACAVAA